MQSVFLAYPVSFLAMGEKSLLLFETQPHSVAQASLQPIAILLPCPPKYLDYRWATISTFEKLFVCCCCFLKFLSVRWVPQNKGTQGNAYLGSILHFRSTTEWMGYSLQTSLRKDSSQASSKILSVYCIQLSSTKSQTCTSVTVERQRAIHTPTMAPAANNSHQEWKEGPME